MIVDLKSGNEIRVVTKSETGTPGLLGPPSINEFFKGCNAGFYDDGHGSHDPRKVLAYLLAEGRIDQDEHTALTIEVDKAQLARAEGLKLARVPDLKYGHEFSIGTDGFEPIVIQHYKNTDDFLRAYVICEGCYDVPQVLDYLKLHCFIDGDGYRTLFEQFRKATDG